MRLALLLVMLLGTSSYAQEAPGGLVQEVDATLVEAHATYQKGVRLVQARKYHDALVAFERVLPRLRAEADAVDVLYNLVQVGRALKRWDKVLAYAQGYRVLDAESAEGKRMETLVGLAQGQTTALELVVEAPADARLYVDDVPAKSPVWVSPGNHRVTATRVGFKPFASEVSVVQKTTVVVALAPLEGKLEIKSKPVAGVDVYLDDAKVGTTPLTPLVLVAKRYLVRFELAGHASWTRYITVEPDATTTVSPTLERAP